METDDDLERLAVRLLSQTSRFTRAASRIHRGQHSLVGLRALANLERHGTLRVGELARLEGVSQPGMTAALNRLADDGMVNRLADPDDARAAAVTLTDAGREGLEGFRAQTAGGLRPLLRDLPPSDREALERTVVLLERFAAAIGD